MYCELSVCPTGTNSQSPVPRMANLRVYRMQRINDIVLRKKSASIPRLTHDRYGQAKSPYCMTRQSPESQQETTERWVFTQTFARLVKRDRRSLWPHQ